MSRCGWSLASPQIGAIMSREGLSPKPRVFISYARKDGEEFATNLRKRLVVVAVAGQAPQPRVPIERVAPGGV
jgi:hypothetical protein